MQNTQKKIILSGIISIVCENPQEGKKKPKANTAGSQGAPSLEMAVILVTSFCFA